MIAYLCIGFIVLVVACGVGWLAWEMRHAPLMSDDEIPLPITGEGGKR